MLVYILFAIGFVLLIKGADLLVTGASSIARRFNISSLVIGLTIVAFGTSMPELVVSTVSSLQGNTDIAIGNILGSNIANVLLILGICAAIYPLTVQKNTAWKEIPFSLLAVVCVFFLANDIFIDGNQSSQISRSEGLVLISFFVIFLYYTFGIASSASESTNENQESIAPMKIAVSIAYVVGGLAGLVLGGQWIVDGAVKLASTVGLSQSIIGLTVIAIGTSLPELATSVVATMKKQTDIAIGNVVGSNIFNVFWILGFSSILSPLPFQNRSNIDIIMAIVATILLFSFCFVGKKHMLTRIEGVIFIIIYILYVGFLVAQEMGV